MIKLEGRLAGILGTVIIHLIAAILFMVFQIGSLQKKYTAEYVLEVVPVEEPVVKEPPKELPVTTVEQVLHGDQEMLNIARNLANKGDPKINAADYIDKVKEELINSGKLGTDNYIDEQKRLAASKGEENITLQSDSTNTIKENKSDESRKMAANYKGPTRIYYNLPGRVHAYLPVPIYLCQGSGKVVLSIEVNRKGEVEKAQIITGESTTTDPCLIETAKSTALISRFNPDISSPGIQTGTLTYMFVAQ